MRPLSKSPRGHATQAVLALVSSVALSASSISAILAQEVGEDEPTDQSGEIGEATEPSGGSNEAGAQFDQVTLVDRMPLPDGIANSGNRGMVVWAEGRVGYFPVDEAKGLAAVDLTTLQEVARQEVAGPGQAIYGAGNSSSQHQFAIDDASGTLYVPIQDDGIASGSDNLVCAQSLLVTDACLGEIRVIDGVTLEVLASHRFRPITIDGVATLPVLRAMSYSPATDGTTAKLHLFVEAQFTPGFSDADARTRANFAYAVQMDAATGQTDWVTRLSGCTDFHQSASVANAGRRNAIFHVADDEAPRLYVGCYRSRGATAIVKVELNGSDPLMAPVGQQAFNGLPEAAGYLPDHRENACWSR